jgi:23S rRNA (cytosine1962-C5)-methyltransferase
MNLPKLKIKPRSEIRIVHGNPWIFSNEIENFSELKTLEKGSLVEVIIKKKESFALAYFNPHSLIAARILSYNSQEKIDEDFFVKKILTALSLREKFFNKAFYRLIHSEGDFLPGLIIDRFDDIFSCQISTAGMEKLTPILLAALKIIFPQSKVILRNDMDSRKLESLELFVKEIDEIPDLVKIEENNVEFLIDVKKGQKTGWFYDQRKNREFIASIAQNCDVLDAYCYLGGFGLNTIKNNAKSVTFIDSSKEALDKIPQLENIEIINEKVFEALEKLELQKRRFDIVLLDPPAFIKSKKDLFSGLKGYEKLIKLAVNLVNQGGILMLTSCSHHASLSDLISALNDGFRKSNRRAKLIRNFGADIDHPINPALKENEYLKSITFLVE